MIAIDEDAFPGYTLWSYNRAGEVIEDIVGIPWDNQIGVYVNIDNGLQKIILVVKHHGEGIITIEGLKAER